MSGVAFEVVSPLFYTVTDGYDKRTGLAYRTTPVEKSLEVKIDYERYFPNFLKMSATSAAPLSPEARGINVELGNSLRFLRDLLLVETVQWLPTGPCVTSDNINRYIASIDLLMLLIEKNDLGKFISTFRFVGISVRGIRDCFRATSEGNKELARQNRNQASGMFRQVCQRVTARWLLDSQESGSHLTYAPVAVVDMFEGIIREVDEIMKEDA